MHVLCPDGQTYSVFILLWSLLMLKKWKRLENRLAYEWKARGLERPRGGIGGGRRGRGGE